jgi:predicted nucleic acid-binding protein
MPADFLDTNVLIYLAFDQSLKADRAEALVAAGATISVQVLNEIANVARRKRARSWQEVQDFLASIRSLLAVEPLTLETHQTGLLVAERYKLAIYDSMIVASALGAGCKTLWSEDMQDGLVIEGALTIRNPFGSPSA